MIKRIVGLLMVFSLLLVGCSSDDTNNKKETVISVTDSTGAKVTLEEAPKKVIVLSSSWGEIWQLAGGDIAGITSDAFSERDLGLQEEVIDVGTIKDPNLEIILEAEPDFVILSEDISSHADIGKALNEVGVVSYTTKVETFDGYLKVLSDFCEITGTMENYETYGTKVKEEVETLLAKLPKSNEGEKTALFLRAFSSGVKAIAEEHIVCDILDQILVENIAKTEGFPLDDLSLEVILEQDPEYIFIVTMGDEEKAREAINTSLASDPAWATLTAVQNDALIYLPKDLFHYKPNARWAEAYETILKIVYPETYK